MLREHRRAAARAAARPRGAREALGFVDMERARETSGSRFAYLMGDAALLEFALVHCALARLGADGFMPVVPPVLVREQHDGGGRVLPDRPRAGLRGRRRRPVPRRHERDPALGAAPRRAPRRRRLPIRYAGISTCFRREAGTYGKDTRGSSACTSSTRSRCSRSPSPTVVGRARPHPRHRGVDRRRARAALPRREHRGRRPRRRPRPRSTTSRCGCRRRAATASSRRARTTPTTRPAASAPRAGRARHPARAHAERHRVRDRPHARVPVRALPGRRRRFVVPEVLRPSPASTASTPQDVPDPVASLPPEGCRSGRMGRS